MRPETRDDDRLAKCPVCTVKASGLATKIGIGLLAGFGVCILLNAIIEVLDLGGVF